MMVLAMVPPVLYRFDASFQCFCLHMRLAVPGSACSIQYSMYSWSTLWFA